MEATPEQLIFKSWLATEISQETGRFLPGALLGAGRLLDHRLEDGQWRSNWVASLPCSEDSEGFYYTIATSEALGFLQPQTVGLFQQVWNVVSPSNQPDHIDCNIARSRNTSSYAAIFLFSRPTPGFVRAVLSHFLADVVLHPGHTLARPTAGDLAFNGLSQKLEGYPASRAKLALELINDASNPELLAAATILPHPSFGD